MKTSKVTIHTLRQMKARGEKIAMLTAYDATFARLFDEAGADVLLVGDSLGMVVQGHDTTLPVTLDEIAYHCRAVARGPSMASRTVSVMMRRDYPSGWPSATARGIVQIGGNHMTYTAPLADMRFALREVAGLERRHEERAREEPERGVLGVPQRILGAGRPLEPPGRPGLCDGAQRADARGLLPLRQRLQPEEVNRSHPGRRAPVDTDARRFLFPAGN